MNNSAGHRIRTELKSKGADFIEFVDISQLPYKQNKGFQVAILIGILLSPTYLLEVSKTPDYVEKMKREMLTGEDEFNLKELMTDRLADYTAGYLLSIGNSAYSQSEKNISSTGFYNKTDKSTPLPHKTIAGLAGMGWIGKHNLLVTPEYGSAFSMCTVLTNAPLETVLYGHTSSKCGDCEICVKGCQVKAIKGKTWSPGLPRDAIVDVSLCNTCLKCMVLCPWTQKYIKRGLNK